MTVIAEDQESIRTLSEFTGASHDVAARMLHKYGNMDRAADAIFAGESADIAVPSTSSQQRNTTPERGYYDTDVPQITIGPAMLPGATHSTIDLTDSGENAVMFGPSNRPPDPNYQMVPYDAGVHSQCSTFCRNGSISSCRNHSSSQPRRKNAERRYSAQFARL